MTFQKIILLLLIAGFISGCSSTKDIHNTPIGLINNVTYKDAKFNNSNASNGFLVEYEDETFAITAKHILIIAKTNTMKFIDFEGELKEWKMHPKDNSDSYVIMNELLNTNRKDSLNWDYLRNNWDNYDDWLVFSIKENKSKHKPLEFRETNLIKDEQLFAVGWTYADTSGHQRVYEYKYDETEGNFHNLIQTKGPKSLGGLSGSPVVDAKGRLVGLVSSGWEDEETKEVFLQATSSTNMLAFLKQNK